MAKNLILANLRFKSAFGADFKPLAHLPEPRRVFSAAFPTKPKLSSEQLLPLQYLLQY